jgi:IS5 family transposase
MGPKARQERSDHDLFQTGLVNLIAQRHKLAWLAGLINWQAFADEWSPQFVSTTGRPALPARLMAALLYLKHAYARSNEDVMERWCENPYWQHFNGEHVTT